MATWLIWGIAIVAVVIVAALVTAVVKRGK